MEILKNLRSSSYFEIRRVTLLFSLLLALFQKVEIKIKKEEEEKNSRDYFTLSNLIPHFLLSFLIHE